MKSETQACMPDCRKEPVDCKLSEWSYWSDCSKTCEGGQKTRTRTVEQEAKFGGKTCGDSAEGLQLKEVAACNDDLTCVEPVDCAVEEWGSWDVCSKTCGGGQQYRERGVAAYPKHAGAGAKLCENLSLREVRACAEEECKSPIDCAWGYWSDWSPCSATCGGGQKSRFRKVDVSPKYGGALCHPLSKHEVEACNMEECGPNGGCIDAKWTEWSKWSACTATCGKGYKYRVRTVAQQANECGQPLEGLARQFMECGELPICGDEPEDCEMSSWSYWGDCSNSCNGIKERTRSISKYSKGMGAACEGALKEVEPCNVDVCVPKEPKNCELSGWTSWSECSQSCDGGIKYRTRHITQFPENGGTPCSDALKEVTACNYAVCSSRIDCKWTEWNDWSSCSKECGGGQRNRFRSIAVMPLNGGVPCDHKASGETEPCNTHTCGTVNFCYFGQWSDWGDCSSSCGLGTQGRERTLALTSEAVTADEEVIASGTVLNLLFHSPHRSSVRYFGAFITGMFVSTGLMFAAMHMFMARGHVTFSTSNPMHFASDIEARQQSLVANDFEMVE